MQARAAVDALSSRPPVGAAFGMLCAAVWSARLAVAALGSEGSLLAHRSLTACEQCAMCEICLNGAVARHRLHGAACGMLVHSGHCMSHVVCCNRCWLLEHVR